MKDLSRIELSIFGKHPVREALNSPNAKVQEVFFSRKDGQSEIQSMAQGKRIPIRTIGGGQAKKVFGNEVHQGVGARVRLSYWSGLKSFFASQSPSSIPMGIAIDGIEDPQNFGSILRSAHFFGAGFCLSAKDRAAPLSGSVAKASAGAIFRLPLVRATNLARELDLAKDSGFWVLGMDANAPESIEAGGYGRQPVLLVLGSEGKGLRSLTAKTCDELRHIPCGKEFDSLNAAVAAAVSAYEVSRQIRSMAKT